MKEVTAYKSSDGKIHDTELLARAHEVHSIITPKIKEILNNKALAINQKENQLDFDSTIITNSFLMFFNEPKNQEVLLDYFKDWKNKNKNN